MKYINDLTYQCNENSIILMGKFDGVHRGHQLLIEKAREAAKRLHCPCVAITFSDLVVKQSAITTDDEKKYLIEYYGIDYLILYPFREICNLSAKEFVQDILVKKLKAACVIAGSDCGFGKNRSANAKDLVEFGKQYGFETIILDKIFYDDEEISSSTIRNMLLDGRISMANELLGHPFEYCGEVVEGRKLGRNLGFPTININIDSGKVLVPKGVYHARVNIDGTLYEGICNIGSRPTVSKDGSIKLEMHIFDYDGNLYGRNLCVQMMDFIRPEMEFDTVEKLKEQIRKDCCTLQNRLHQV